MDALANPRSPPAPAQTRARNPRLPARRDGNYALVGLDADIVVKDHYWVRLDDGAAGNAIDFFVTLRNKSFNEAMRLLAEPDDQG